MIPFTQLCKQPRTDLNKSPLPAPLNVYLELTNECQFRCACCPESRDDFEEQQGGRHMLSWADWESVAAKLEEVGRVKSLHFYMLGEPLLNRNATAIIADANRRSLAEKTILTTNGILIGRYAQNLSQCGLTYLRVSLYEQYRKAWPKIADGLEVLRYMPGRPFLYVKAFGEHADGLNPFRVLADEVEVERMHNWNGTAGELGGAEAKDRSSPCPMPFYTLVIHSDLRVSVCCVDWDKKLVVGDLKRQSLAEVWTSEEMHTIRLMHLAGRQSELPGCATCSMRDHLQDAVTLSPMEYARRVYGTTLRSAGNA